MHRYEKRFLAKTICQLIVLLLFYFIKYKIGLHLTTQMDRSYISTLQPTGTEVGTYIILDNIIILFKQQMYPYTYYLVPTNTEYYIIIGTHIRYI